MENKIDSASFRNGGGGLQKLISAYKILRYGIRAGKGCVIKATSAFRLTDGAILMMGDNVTIQDYVFFQLTKPQPKVVIGSEVVIGRGSIITAKRNITIGSYTRMGAFVQIIDHGHGFDKGDLIMNQEATFGDVYIGEDVWIGTGAKILKGVKIGDGAVIGANAVVTKDIPSGSVAVGVPARVIKQRGD